MNPSKTCGYICTTRLRPGHHVETPPCGSACGVLWGPGERNLRRPDSLFPLSHGWDRLMSLPIDVTSMADSKNKNAPMLQCVNDSILSNTKLSEPGKFSRQRRVLIGVVRQLFLNFVQDVCGITCMEFFEVFPDRLFKRDIIGQVGASSQPARLSSL